MSNSNNILPLVVVVVVFVGNNPFTIIRIMIVSKVKVDF